MPYIEGGREEGEDGIEHELGSVLAEEEEAHEHGGGGGPSNASHVPGESSEPSYDPWHHSRVCPPVLKVRGAESVQPLRMGLFEIITEGFPFYRNTEGEFMFFEPKYKEWRIGEDKKKPHAGISSKPMEVIGCPQKCTEWYAFVQGKWTQDYHITVLPEECPIELGVTGAESTQLRKMGRFYMTLHEQDGRPVYENKQNEYLYYWAEFGEWRIGEDWQTASAGIASMRGESKQCPTEPSGWFTYTQEEWRKVYIVVTKIERNEKGEEVNPVWETAYPAAKAAKGEAMDNRSIHSDQDEENWTASDYIVANASENQCPLGTRELKVDECKEVAIGMGRTFGGIQDEYTQPRGCYHIEDGTFSNGDVFYNQNLFGTPSKRSQPLCWKKNGETFENIDQNQEFARNGSENLSRFMVGSGVLNSTLNLMNKTTGIPITVENATTENSTEEELYHGTELDHDKKKKGGGGVVVIIIVGGLIVVGIICFLRRRQQQQAEEEAKAKEEKDAEEAAAAGQEGAAAAAEARAPAMGDQVTVVSLGREGVVSFGPDEENNYKVTFQDDGTESELLPATDLQLPAPPPADASGAAAGDAAPGDAADPDAPPAPAPPGTHTGQL